ncbi:hypothetical protein [Streptomyces sp. SID161]|uniref:hypothetical protein n=1 Tax=Streptomyces sp. SID161 TaxID=2690251 RepID=UPI00136FE880|nr:hypothetical protein [Streptomyces sp. SID161]MYW46377.1 hypothetical protein [Streptomyces sp. SID161]
MPARTSKALQAWLDLNDRQQGTLAVIYELDQGAEAGRGRYDDRPASEWRSIDFAHEPAMRDIFGFTMLQERLMWQGWDNQGNGSTMAALERRGLITRDSKPTSYGRMHTVRLTREGRAAARAGSSLTPGGRAKAALGRRSWEVRIPHRSRDDRADRPPERPYGPRGGGGAPAVCEPRARQPGRAVARG